MCACTQKETSIQLECVKGNKYDKKITGEKLAQTDALSGKKKKGYNIRG